MIFIDTNVLVYAANPRLPFHEACRSYLERCRRGSSPWYLSWPVCYEFLRVCTHPVLFAKPWPLAVGWDFITALLESGSGQILLPTARHGETLAEVISEIPHLKGSILHDAHTAVLMREHGIREIYTRDTDFHRFPFLKVIDPVAG
jgi:toxin-antitoxin system PIN domain toxin